MLATGHRQREYTNDKLSLSRRKRHKSWKWRARATRINEIGSDAKDNGPKTIFHTITTDGTDRLCTRAHFALVKMWKINEIISVVLILDMIQFNEM